MSQRLRRWMPWVIGSAVIFGPGAVAQVQAGWWEYQLSKQVRELRVARAELSEERTRLESDPVYVEGLIRTTFKVANPDEVVVILGDDTTPAHRGRDAGW